MTKANTEVAAGMAGIGTAGGDSEASATRIPTGTGTTGGDVEASATRIATGTGTTGGDVEASATRIPTGIGTTGAAVGSGDPAPAGRPLRRDAERNRQLILDTAKIVFAQRGLDASLDEVAHAAGLGVGTVYRRFPNRDALIDALYADMIASIERIVAESVALPRAWDGLVHFMTAMLETQGRDKAVRDLLLSGQRHLDPCERDKDEVVRDAVQPALYQLIATAQDAGDLRPDVVPTDVGVLLIGAVGVVDFTAPADAQVWRRHLAVIFDGLRARPDGSTTALGPEPLDEDQLDVCMTGWKYGTRETPRRRS